MDIFLGSPKVAIEHERCLRAFPGKDPYDSKDNVGLLDVVRAQFLVVDYFVA